MALESTLAEGAARLESFLKNLASPRWTVVFFLMTAISVLLVKENLTQPTSAMVLPFSLLILNLGSSIAIHPRFRADLPLLIFHLALLLIVALFVVGRLTYMYGSINVLRSAPFDGVVDKLDHGPLHGAGYRDLKFVHGRTIEKFNDEIGHHIEIRNLLRWQDVSGRWQETELRFGYPIIMDGYRIYPSGRRGYVPIFEWQPNHGPGELGAVQLFGANEEFAENSNDWLLPNGQKAWLLLEKKSPGPPPRGTVRTDLGASELEHHLVVRIGDDRHELRLGDEMAISGGVLRYVKLESWGGYSLIYDPTEPWLIASLLIAVSAMGWFYYRRFNRSSGGGE